jgi:hypothetical protein
VTNFEGKAIAEILFFKDSDNSIPSESSFGKNGVFLFIYDVRHELSHPKSMLELSICAL